MHYPGTGGVGGRQPMGGLFSGLSAGLGMAMDVGNWFQQRKQFDYQKQLQQTIFDREDTAMQRKAADMEAAGMSRHAAAGGGGAGAGAAVPVAAPQGSNQNTLAAISMQKMKADISKVDAEKDVMKAQAHKFRMDADLQAENTKYRKIETAYAEATQKDRISAAAAALKGQNLDNELKDLSIKALNLDIDLKGLDKIAKGLANQLAGKAITEKELAILSLGLAIDLQELAEAEGIHNLNWAKAAGQPTYYTNLLSFGWGESGNVVKNAIDLIEDVSERVEKDRSWGIDRETKAEARRLKRAEQRGEIEARDGWEYMIDRGDTETRGK